ncbi:MAG: hypothetical protein IPL61_34885 [Myxococcales bacterium]|nr:hypothetical protein [Myxococcales bacterium]
MAWTPHQVLAWLDQVEPRADGLSHFEWLELAPTAGSSAIQGAYHAVARTRHPDLFRKSLSARDFDRLTRMYARVTGAYAELRKPEAAATYLRVRRASSQPGEAAAIPGGATPPPPAPPPPPPPAPAAPVDPTRSMNARALVLYRRAEGALRTGDRTTAVLNIKMAIAADPSSQLLRGALAELTKPK